MTFQPQATIAINGKFYGAGFTAVHRVARELVQAMDQIRVAQGDTAPRMEIVCPESGDAPPGYRTMPMRRAGAMTGQAWEQLELPGASRGSLLLNLCNLGPVLASRAVTLIHDAQVFSTPESYTPAFAAWYRNIYRAIGRRHTIVTVSNFSRAELGRHGVANSRDIAVVPNGVDHIGRTSADRSILARHELVRHRYVVAVANTQPHKNIRVILRAFARPELAGMKLVLFGSATRADFKAAGLALPENVILTGSIRDDELRALFEGALCMACPSLTEGFGLPPLESMSLGTPAIISPLGALPEVCGPGALIAAAQDHERWAGQIVRLSAQELLRRRLSIQGRAHAGGFTWKRSAEAMISVLAQHTLTRPVTQEQVDA